MVLHDIGFEFCQFVRLAIVSFSFPSPFLILLPDYHMTSRVLRSCEVTLHIVHKQWKNQLLYYRSLSLPLLVQHSCLCFVHFSI